MQKIFFILGTSLALLSCTDHSTMVEMEGDSSSSAIKLSSSAIGLSSSDNFSSESLQSSSAILSSSSLTAKSSSSVASSSSVSSSSSSQNFSSSITQSSSSLVTSSSSSVIVSSSSSSIEYGSITYEGQTYKTVKIGTQTWMAENLNYAVDSSWCYNNSADNCAKYGRLYQWASAMDIDSAYNSKTWSGSDVNHQGICPDDWHLPSNDEWQTLYDYVDANNGSEGVGTSLKSADGWTTYSGVATGTNGFGFSAFPAGNRGNDSNFSGADILGLFWSASEKYSGYANYWFLNYNSGDFGGNSYNDKGYGFSIRCLKDSV